MELQQYFYLWGTFILLPLWLYMFSKKDKRRDMLFIGLAFGLGAVFIDKFYATLDYWSPIYIIPWLPLEDFLYGFVFGGVSAEVYEIVMKKRNSTRRIYHPHKKLVLLFGIITAFSFWVIVDYLKFNSIIAHIIPPIIVGIVSIIIHKEIYKIALVNSIVMTLLTFVIFQIMLLIYPEIFQNHWHLSKLSGIFFFRIPIEELLFAFAVGFAQQTHLK